MERDVRSEGPAGKEAGTSALWAIWGSMLGSLAIYAAAGILLEPEAPASLGAGARDALVAMLGFAAVAQIVAVFALRALLARRMTYTSWCIVRWAVAESAGVFGLVAVLLGAERSIMALFIAGAALVLVLWRPGSAAEEAYRGLRG